MSARHASPLTGQSSRRFSPRRPYPRWESKHRSSWRSSRARTATASFIDNLTRSVSLLLCAPTLDPACPKEGAIGQSRRGKPRLRAAFEQAASHLKCFVKRTAMAASDTRTARPRPSPRPDPRRMAQLWPGRDLGEDGSASFSSTRPLLSLPIQIPPQIFRPRIDTRLDESPGQGSQLQPATRVQDETYGERSMEQRGNSDKNVNGLSPQPSAQPRTPIEDPIETEEQGRECFRRFPLALGLLIGSVFGFFGIFSLFCSRTAYRTQLRHRRRFIMGLCLGVVLNFLAAVIIATIIFFFWNVIQQPHDRSIMTGI